jgi:hypothetical protein
MILNNNELNERINNPDNLINRLNVLRQGKSDKKALDIFIPPNAEENKSESTNPQLPPSIDELEEQIKNGLIKSTARKVLGDSLDLLSHNINNVDNPNQLSRIARDMREILKEDKDSDSGKQPGQVIIYRPIINQEQNYNAVYVND